MQASNVRHAPPAILPNPASSVRSDKAAQPQVAPGGIPAGVPAADTAISAAGTDRLPPVFPAALSADDLDALQSVDHGKYGNSPAQQARTFIADNPEFADVPFGHVVSQFARGETPVATPASDPAAETPPSTDTSSDMPATDTPPIDIAGSDVPPPTDTPTDETGADVPPTNTSGDVPPTDVPVGMAGSDADQTLLDALAG